MYNIIPYIRKLGETKKLIYTFQDLTSNQRQTKTAAKSYENQWK